MLGALTFSASMMKTDERDKDKDKEKEKDKDKDKDKEKDKGKDKESQNKSPKDDFFDVKLIMDTFSDFYRTIWPPLWSLINLWNQELGDVDSLQKASPGKKGVNLKNVTGDVASMIFDQKESLGFAHTFLTNFSYEAKETIATSLSKNPMILNAISPPVKHDTFASNPLVFKAYTMLIPRSTTEIKPSDGTFFSIINVDEAPIPKCECRKMKKDKKLTSWECGCEQMLAVSMARKPIINDKPIAKLAKKDFADQKDIAKLLSIAAGEKTLFHPRTVMGPNEMMRYEISFDPKVEGLYQTTYDVEVQGWPQSHTQVKVEGICDIPRIDFRPKKMFKKLIRDYNEDVLYFNSYIDSMHHFEFGPVFKTSIKNKILPVKFIIRNTSTLPMQVVFTFLKGGIYNISPTEMSLPPGVRKSLSVTAAPPSIGAQPDELLFCVKDNPCVGIVKINCIGITANFSVNLRTLDFGKLLLYRRGKKRIILSNKCVLPIKWKIRPNPDMDKLFVFSESKGVIQPKKMVEVEVEFFANIVGEFHGIPLHFDIYDFNEIEEYSEVLTSEVLTLSAECYDVLIDCMFNDFEDDHLDFGDIRIASTQELTMTLGNRGNNEMLYRISKAKFSQMDGVKFDPEENIESKGIAARKFANGLFVEPTHGLILPGHAYVVTVLYESMVPLEAKRIHTLSVELLDPSKHGHDGVEGDEGQPGVRSDIPHSSGAVDSPRAPPPTAQPASDPSREAVPQHIPQVIVATLPIAVSVCVLYNSFVLHPAQDLNFDAFLVGGKQALNLTLKNTGKFAFFFQLFPPNTPVDFPPLDVKDVELKEEKRTEVINKQEKEKQDKKDKVQRKDSKIKKLDIKASKKESKSFGGPIKLGIFYVSVTSGMIEEDEAIIIPIECVGEKEGFFEEKLKLHITHVHPKYADGIDVRLLAEICLPDIDFWKADTTFRELYVTKTRKDFCCPMALGAHCLYTTEERCVYFLRVAVKTPVQCTLYLNNPTRVSATVTLEARCLPPQVSPTQAAPAPIQPSPGAPSGAIASPIAASAIVGGEQPVFSVTPKFVHLEPYNTAAITLTFAPLVMLEYRGYLDVNLKMPDNQPAKYWQLSLRGRGDAPRIKLERPPAPPPPAPPAPLSFPLLLVGCKLKKSIAIRNICSLALDVVLDIDEPNPHIVAAAETINSVMTAAALSGSPSPPPPTPGPVPISPYDRNDPVGRVQYYLRPERAEKLKHFFFDLDQHMEKHLVEIDQNDEKKYSMKLHLEPDDLAEFNIVFCPMREGKHEVEIKINIINNPFENIILFCKGESFMENLIITDLETLSVEKSTAVATDFVPAGRSVSVYTVESKIKKSKKGTDPDSESILSRLESRKSQRRSFSDSQVSDITEVKYNLDLGRVAVKQLVKKAFNIHNNTLIGHRFQWFGNELMDFTPSSGHIYPTASKEIVIAFLSHDPINLQNLPVLCSLAPMKGILSVKEDYNNVQPWDDQLLASMWKISPDGTHYVKESKLVVPAEPEKDYDEVNRYFILQLNIIADYAAYECNLETIIFKNTLMFQTRNFEIIVKNTGNIPLNISWNFDIGDDYPVTRVPSRVELMNTIHGDEHREPRESPFNKLPDGGSLFSECSQRTCDSWSSLEFPFSISPSKATININEEGKFCLSFAPKDIFDFHVKLESKIESLNEQQSDCIVDVYGRSLLPYCHLDVEESDYVNAHRRDPTLPPLPPDTRVVEYNVFGCGCYHKQFKLMNPTSEDYTYEWIPMVEREYSPIHFEPCRGTLKMGSEEEVNITFTPAGLGVIESLWTFVISKYDVKINFLVVGFVREPSVYFIPSHLDMRPTIKGARVRETIKMIQCEDIPLKFAFEEGSLFTDGLNESLEVSPMTGTLEPQSETTIEVSYTPARTGLILFKLRCQVCYVINPLYITVSCNCLALVPEARLFLRGQILPLRPYAPTDVPLGCIVLNVTEKLIIELRNKGECMIFFEVVYNKYKPLDVVISPTHGCVEPNESVKVDIALTSLEKGLIKNFPITLKVLEGPTYNIIIDSEVTDPAFYFMSTYIDFGPCFVEYPPDFYSTKFFVRNTSSDEILITAEIPESDEIKCVLENGMISPWNDGEILVYFIPRRVHIYQFELVFTINGVCRQKIVVDGEGIALALVLVNPCDKCFTFGGVIVGQEVMKEIKLHNQSKSALTVDFHLPIEVPVKELSVNDDSNNFTQQTKMSNKEKDKDKGKDMDKANKKRKLLAKTARSTSNVVLKKKDSQQEVLRQLMRESLVINPTSYTFQSGEIASVCIQFKPVKSGKHLQEEVWMTTAGVERAICVVRAHALGASIRLDRELLSFGAVTIGCQSTQKFVLVNMGDVGARFEWELTNLNDNFEIFPKKGYAPPESNTVFKATFAPHALNQFVDCLSYCMVENFGRAPLRLIGSCVELPAPYPDPIIMRCMVRKSETTKFRINNLSDTEWNIKPIISGVDFTTIGFFNVPPNSSFDVPITFNPITMGRHEGRLFLPATSYFSLLYDLYGEASEPEAITTIERTVPCKTKYTELLEVKNWLQIPQKFTVMTSRSKLSGSDRGDPYYEINGLSHIAVPADGVHSYKWSIYCYKPCQMTFVVKFLNEDSGEFLWYTMVTAVTKCETIEFIKMKTTVRKKAAHTIFIKNPMESNADFKISCPVNDIYTIEPFFVEGESIKELKITYFPLLVGEYKTTFELINPNLGVFPYALQLECVSGPNEKVECEAVFGYSVKVPTALSNFTKRTSEFTFETDNDCFQGEKKYNVGGNEKLNVDIIFEPRTLGNITAQLTFRSLTAGNFVFDVIAKSLEPQPQGPINIKPNVNTVIPFRNIFKESKTFRWFVEPSIFFCLNYSQTIKPKTEGRIVLSMKPVTKLNGETEKSDKPYGRLVISCADPQFSHVNWVYYLTANIPD